MKQVPEIDHSELYSVRLLAFVETGPQSNEYHQFQFTEEQFKKVSDAIANCFTVTKEDDTRDDIDTISNVNISNETYKLPDLKQINIWIQNIEKI